MDGMNLHAHCKVTPTETMADTLGRLWAESDEETRRIIKAIQDIGIAAQHRADPELLHDPAVALTNLIAELEPSGILDGNKFQLLSMAKMFVSSTMRLVDIRSPVPRAALPNLAGLAANSPDPAPQPQQPVLRPQQDDVLHQGDESDDVVPPPTPPVAAAVPARPAVGPPTKPTPRTKSTPPTPATVAVARRRSTRMKSTVVHNAAVDDATAKAEDFEMVKCDDCDVMIAQNDLLLHTWKKHKEHVYKFMKPDTVCTISYCDYASASTKGRRVHETKSHSATPLAQEDVLEELEAGQCRYCAADIDSVASFKTHMIQCDQRDERAPLGCTSCDKEFHFIYDFVTHLKVNGSLTHGKPKLLED